MDNRFRNLEKSLWETSFFATLWSLWLVRNEYVFNNATLAVGVVVEKVKARVAMWVKAKFDVKVYSVEEFKVFLDGIRRLKL
jgi:exo-beta-1,3-glucanase (GH17 family)